jgi:hypothetical protein
MAAQGWAQEQPETIQAEAFDLGLDASISRIRLVPGGFVRITGSATYQPDGTVWDAATERTSSGTHDGGLIDAAASGLVLRDRDPESHTYQYEPAEAASEVCARVGLSSPCLVLRLPALAAARRRDLGELREDLTGGLHVEVHLPVAPSVIPPLVVPPLPQVTDPSYLDREEPDSGWFWMGAVGLSGGGLVLSLAVLLVAGRRRRKSKTPVSRARAAAGRLRKKLAGDTVRARLLMVVNDLAEEAGALEMVEHKLKRAVEDAKPEELEQRYQELTRTAAALAAKGGAEAGEGELNDAAAIVEGQIERCRKWEMQRWRSAARMERIATRLEALEAELNDPAQDKIEKAGELLDLLQEELELARAGEQEAQRLLGSGSTRSEAA